MEEQNNQQNKEENKEEKIDFQPTPKKPCVVEGYKTVELMKYTEQVLEKNLKLYLGTIIALVITQIIIDFIPASKTMFLVLNIINTIITLAVSIVIIRRVKIEADSINLKRKKGSLVKQLLFSFFLYFILVLFIAVIAFALAFVYKGAVESGMEETFLLVLGGIVMFFAIPLVAASIYISCVFDGIIFEIFAKDNRGFSTIKDTFFYLHKSKNSTLSKLIVSNLLLVAVTFLVILVNFAPLVDMAKESFGLMDYVMMFVMNALMSIISVYFLTNRFIIYMSSRTEY